VRNRIQWRWHRVLQGIQKNEQQYSIKYVYGGTAMEKKDKLKDKINKFINVVIDKAVEDGNLEHFEIEISNHQGNLQMNSTTKKREKVY